LLDSTSVIRKNRRPLLGNASVTHCRGNGLLATMNCDVCAGRAEKYREDNLGYQVSSVWESVKKSGSWNGAAFYVGLVRLKLKNLHC
jgi:hypothetical protein